METLKKLNSERVEITTSRESDVVVFERKDIEKEIIECEETIARNKRWLATLDEKN